MAVDTRDKRASIICYGLPYPGLFPNPSGAIDQTDFEQTVGFYDGIQASGAGQPMWLRWGGVQHMGHSKPFGRSW